MKRIVNVKRFVISNIILFLILFIFSCALINNTYSYTQTIYKTIYIDEGETLWEIAEIEQQKNPYYKDKDVRDIIHKYLIIIILNKLIKRYKYIYYYK